MERDEHASCRRHIAELSHKLHNEQGTVRCVVRRLPNGDREMLQIIDVHPTRDGLWVEVR
jgi:hypothetical protein